MQREGIGVNQSTYASILRSCAGLSSSSLGSQSWNAIIVGHARNDQGFSALQLFRRMQITGVGVDEISFSGVFSACAAIQGHLEGLQMHGKMRKMSSSFQRRIFGYHAVYKKIIWKRITLEDSYNHGSLTFGEGLGLAIINPVIHYIVRLRCFQYSPFTNVSHKAWCWWRCCCCRV
ncbi:hypothetical protein MKX01_010670 [Papaver californicum]|nr:hypothetical protein MKX01_010670 [Papaver californicum]